MALTDKDLQNIISELSEGEQRALLEKLKDKFDTDRKAKPVHSETPVQRTDGKSYSCTVCGSINCKKHGTTASGMQRYICKNCGKTFSENNGEALRYSHLSEDIWKEMIRGFVEESSLATIANNIGCSTKTVWLAKQKVNQAIMAIYGYNELFQGQTQADEYYTRAAFKGKRDPEFFIYTLKRMPRHHRNYAEKVEWLQKAGLYEKLQKESPDYLEELLGNNPKMKKGINKFNRHTD